VTKKPVKARAKKKARGFLNEIDSKELLRSADIPATETRLARTQAQAIAISQEMGFPVVLKIVSADVVHKSDVGGVRLGLTNKRQVAIAHREILASVRRAHPGADIEGVSVQRMARTGTEVIIGMSKDPQFGPVLMFGLGGILVEVLKDVSFRIVPLNPRDAREMVREIKGFPVLEGFRGQEPANIPYLEEMILKVSRFVEKHEEIKELDLNPVFAYSDGAVAVDARVILEEAES
jgi:acyl-CoA synthetase (NDP forming)